MTMGCSYSTETTPLLDKTSTESLPKHSLGLFPPAIRPYLELIRLEKVGHTDFVLRLLFLRLEKPTGTKLMFWPFGISLISPSESHIEICSIAWALTMAAHRVNLPLEQYWVRILKCLFGAFILRSSACTINDILDRDIDSGVGM